MNRDLGVWTSEDCGLALLDYQKDQPLLDGAPILPRHARVTTFRLDKRFPRAEPANLRRSAKRADSTLRRAKSARRSVRELPSLRVSGAGSGGRVQSGPSISIAVCDPARSN